MKIVELSETKLWTKEITNDLLVYLFDICFYLKSLEIANLN